VFTFPHYLGSAPRDVNVWATNAAALAATVAVTSDATNVTLTFSSAPCQRS